MSSATKGWRGKLRVATTEGGLTTDEPDILNVSPSFENNVEAAYELGSRDPKALEEGNIEISVTIKKYYKDNTWAQMAGVGSTGALTEYYLRAYPKGTSSGKPYVTFLGKFGNWELGEEQGGFATESFGFVGRAVSVGTVP